LSIGLHNTIVVIVERRNNNIIDNTSFYKVFIKNYLLKHIGTNFSDLYRFVTSIIKAYHRRINNHYVNHCERKLNYIYAIITILKIIHL